MLKSSGWVVGWVVLVAAHVITVSAQVPLVLTLGLWTWAWQYGANSLVQKQALLHWRLLKILFEASKTFKYTLMKLLRHFGYWHLGYWVWEDRWSSWQGINSFQSRLQKCHFPHQDTHFPWSLESDSERIGVNPGIVRMLRETVYMNIFCFEFGFWKDRVVLVSTLSDWDMKNWENDWETINLPDGQTDVLASRDASSKSRIILPITQIINQS